MNGVLLAGMMGKYGFATKVDTSFTISHSADRETRISVVALRTTGGVYLFPKRLQASRRYFEGPSHKFECRRHIHCLPGSTAEVGRLSCEGSTRTRSIKVSTPSLDALDTGYRNRFDSST